MASSVISSAVEFEFTPPPPPPLPPSYCLRELYKPILLRVTLVQRYHTVTRRWRPPPRRPPPPPPLLRSIGALAGRSKGRLDFYGHRSEGS